MPQPHRWLFIHPFFCSVVFQISDTPFSATNTRLFELQNGPQKKNVSKRNRNNAGGFGNRFINGQWERERALVRDIALHFVFLTKHEQERLSHFDANQNETHRFYKAHSLSSHCISVLLNFPNSLTAFLYLKIHSPIFWIQQNEVNQMAQNSQPNRSSPRVSQFQGNKNLNASSNTERSIFLISYIKFNNFLNLYKSILLLQRIWACERVDALGYIDEQNGGSRFCA